MTAISTPIPRDVVVAEALTRCAIARGGVIDDVTLSVYMDELEDLDAGMISRVCRVLGKLERREFEAVMPSVGAIRAQCKELQAQDRMEAQRQRLLPAPSDDDPRTWRHCNACDDTGWEEMWCVGDSSIPQPDYRLHLTARDCGRVRGHTSHTYVRRCDCINRNPVIARRRELEAQQVVRREKRK